MKLFLTGATGLVGMNTVPILLARGHQVTAMVRSVEKARGLFGDRDGLSFVTGDLDGIASMEGALAGMDGVIHAAALFTEYYIATADWAKFEQQNVVATVELFRMAKRAGVTRAVFLSSVGALADAVDQLWDEDQVGDLYRKSKVVAEKRLAADPELRDYPIVTLRPGWVFGPDDPAPTSTGRMTEELVREGMTGVVRGEALAVVDARDVGLAIALAVETVDRRASFNIAGSEITTESALRQIAAHIPKAKLLVAPLWLAVGVGSLLDLKVRLFGGFNPMPPNGLRFTAERLHVDTTRSIQELGMTYRPFAETARDVAQYWIRRCA